MKRETCRICCTGYFDEQLADFKRIEDVMVEIEQFRIRRPEFELVLPKGSKLPQVFAALLVREAQAGVLEEVVLEGWFVWQSLKGLPDNIVYCKRDYVGQKSGHKHVLLCGAPQAVDLSAILRRAEAARLLEALAKGEPITEFVQGSYSSVLWRDQIQ